VLSYRGPGPRGRKEAAKQAKPKARNPNADTPEMVETKTSPLIMKRIIAAISRTNLQVILISYIRSGSLARRDWLAWVYAAIRVYYVKKGSYDLVLHI
jgi:hypothetical protein